MFNTKLQRSKAHQKPKLASRRPPKSPLQTPSTRLKTTLTASPLTHLSSPRTQQTNAFASKPWYKDKNKKKHAHKGGGGKDMVNLTNAPQLLGGLLPIYKPRGVTSTDLSNYIRLVLTKIHPALRFGFAGTLDENATGVFIGAVGTATPFLRYSLPHNKSYIARLKLGTETDSGDVLGNVTDCRPTPVGLDLNQIQEIIDQQFIGEISHTPPAFSSLKINGERASLLSRQGKQVQMAARKVVIHDCQVLGYDGDYLDIEVQCGKGTYIRSLAIDIANALGTTCHITQLIRTQAGLANIDGGSHEEYDGKTLSEDGRSACRTPQSPKPKTASVNPLMDNYSELVQRNNVYTGNDPIANIILDNQRNYGVYIPLSESVFTDAQIAISKSVTDRFNALKEQKNGGFDPKRRFKSVSIEDLIADPSGQVILENLIPPHFLANYSQYYDTWDEEFNPAVISGQTIGHSLVGHEPSARNHNVKRSIDDNNHPDMTDDGDDLIVPLMDSGSSVKASGTHKAKPIPGLDPSGQKDSNIDGHPIDYLSYNYQSPSAAPLRPDEDRAQPSKRAHYDPDSLATHQKFTQQSAHSHANYLEYHSPIRYMMDYHNGGRFSSIYCGTNTMWYDLHMGWFSAMRPDFYPIQAMKEMRHLLQKLRLSHDADTNYLSFQTMGKLRRGGENNPSVDFDRLVPLYTPNSTYSDDHPVMLFSRQYAIPLLKEMRQPYSFFQEVNVSPATNQYVTPTSDDFTRVAMEEERRKDIGNNKGRLNSYKGKNRDSSPSAQHQQPAFQPTTKSLSPLLTTPSQIDPEVITPSHRRHSVLSDPPLYHNDTQLKFFSDPKLNPNGITFDPNLDLASVPFHRLPDSFPMTPNQLIAHAKYQQRVEELYTERVKFDAGNEYLELWDSVSRSHSGFLFDAKKNYLQTYQRRVPLIYYDARLLSIQRYSNDHRLKTTPVISAVRETMKRWRPWSRVTKDLQGNLLDFDKRGRLINTFEMTRGSKRPTNRPFTRDPDEHEFVFKPNPKMNNKYGRDNYVNDDVAGYIKEYKYLSLGPKQYNRERRLKLRNTPGYDANGDPLVDDDLGYDGDDNNEEGGDDALPHSPQYQKKLAFHLQKQKVLKSSDILQLTRKNAPSVNSPIQLAADWSATHNPPSSSPSPLNPLALAPPIPDMGAGVEGLNALFTENRNIMTFHEKRMFMKRLKIEHSKLLRRLSLETTMLEQLTQHYLSQRQSIYHQRDSLMGEMRGLKEQYTKLNQKVKKSTDIQSILYENTLLKERIRSREEQLLMLTDRLQSGSATGTDQLIQQRQQQQQQALLGPGGRRVKGSSSMLGGRRRPITLIGGPYGDHDTATNLSKTSGHQVNNSNDNDDNPTNDVNTLNDSCANNPQDDSFDQMYKSVQQQHQSPTKVRLIDNGSEQDDISDAINLTPFSDDGQQQQQPNRSHTAFSHDHFVLSDLNLSSSNELTDGGNTSSHNEHTFGNGMTGLHPLGSSSQTRTYDPFSQIKAKPTAAAAAKLRNGSGINFPQHTNKTNKNSFSPAFKSALSQMQWNESSDDITPDMASVKPGHKNQQLTSHNSFYSHSAGPYPSKSFTFDESSDDNASIDVNHNNQMNSKGKRNKDQV